MYKYEKIEDDKNLPIKLVRFLGEDVDPVEKHWHNSLEMVAPLNGGTKVCWIDGESYELYDSHGNGKVLLINSRSIHSFEPEITETVPYIGLALQINYKFLKSLCPHIDTLYFVQPDEIVSKKLREEIYNINDYYDYDSDYKNMMIYGSLYHIIFILLDKLSVKREGFIDNISEKNKNRITKIINYIDSNYQEDLSIKMIAQKFSISEGHLSKIFRENLGLSVKKYITYVRLKHVKDDLMNTDLPLIDIAIGNGFPSLKSLNKSFFEDTGFSPSQFRKKLQN